MTYFSAALYSKRVYARFRSSLALERFIQDPRETTRAHSAKWAKAWLLAVHGERDGRGAARVGRMVGRPAGRTGVEDKVP
jgi:hypothetical protein